MEFKMTRKIAWLKAVVVCAAAVLQVACGGGTDRTKAQVRLVNASSDYTTLELNVDGQLVQGPVGYGTTASYTGIDPGKASSTLTQPGSAAALLSFTPAVGKDKYFTLLAYGALGALKQLLLEDNSGAADDNKTLLRVVNAAPDAGSLDVYLTGSGDDLKASVAVLSGAELGTPSAWLSVSSGSWRLRVTLKNSKTDLRLDLPALELSSKQVVTLVLTPGKGGVLVNALLLKQQSDITRLDNAQARVRVAAGVTSGGAVAAQVAGTPVLNSTNSPAVGGYILVAAGAQSAAVTVAGGRLAPIPFTLTAGADYTLLVRGTPTAAQVSWLEDDNHLPSDATQAKLRLVNGVSGLSGSLAMTADLAPTASDVAAGKASVYAAVTPTLTASLSVTALGVSKPVATLSSQTFKAASTYTVFVLGAADSALAQLYLDR
jgi:Domain of unknown function (DUF4397)